MPRNLNKYKGLLRRLLPTLGALTRGVTVQELVKRHRVTERTVTRDFHAIRAMGFKLTYIPREDSTKLWTVENFEKVLLKLMK